MTSIIQNKISFTDLPLETRQNIIQFIGPVSGDRRSYLSLKTTCKQLFAQAGICTELSPQEVSSSSFYLKSKIIKILQLQVIANSLKIKKYVSPWIEKFVDDSSIQEIESFSEPESYHAIFITILKTYNLNELTLRIATHFPRGTFSKTQLLKFATANGNTVFWNANNSSLTFKKVRDRFHLWIPPQALKSHLYSTRFFQFDLENLSQNPEQEASFTSILKNKHSIVHMGINSQERIHRIIRVCFAEIYFDGLPDPYSSKQPSDLNHGFRVPYRDPKIELQNLFDIFQLIAEYATPSYCLRCSSHENRLEKIHESLQLEDRIQQWKPVNPLEDKQRAKQFHSIEDIETLVSLYAEEVEV